MLKAGLAVRDVKIAPECSHALKLLVALGQPESCRGAQEEESILHQCHHGLDAEPDNHTALSPFLQGLLPAKTYAESRFHFI